jgi:hypothetical protein
MIEELKIKRFARHYPGICLNGLRKAGVAEIRTAVPASVFRVVEVTSTLKVKA